LKIHRSAWGLMLASAALQIVIFPLPGLYWLAWIAVAPLLVAILRARSPETLQLDDQARLLPATPWQGFLLGYACGILWFAGTCYWIFDTMHRYGGMPLPAAALALILFCMYVGRFRSGDPARARGGSISVGCGGIGPDANHRVSMGASGILADGEFWAHADCDAHGCLWALV